MFPGIVEVDETYIGGKNSRMNKKAKAKWDAKHKGARGGAGKQIVACIRVRETGNIQLTILPNTTGSEVKKFVLDRTEAGTEIHTDEFGGYRGLDQLDRIHETINHTESEYARYDGEKTITTNGCESIFGSLKANIIGTCHRISVKHLPYYLDEQSGMKNRRELDTIDQMGAHAMVGKRIRYNDLIAKTPEELAAIEAKQAEEAAKAEGERQVWAANLTAQEGSTVTPIDVAPDDFIPY